MNSPSRTGEYARRTKQEETLQELNRLLATAEDVHLKDWPPTPTLPVVLIVGAPRSGTTLMLQWLAASGCFAYPTNLLSRFFGAPYAGALIQRLLTDPTLDYRNELFELHSLNKLSWRSSVGKTSGVLEPHEFFYFWRRFFPVDQAQKLTDEQLLRSDPDGFARGWASLEKAFQLPIAAKGILLQYDIPRLAQWLPTAVFVHTRRDPVFNVQSILRAREQVFGTRDAWFSARPPEYSSLKHEDPYRQVAGQVEHTNRHIQQALAELPRHRKITVEYETFCSDPSAIWRDLQGCTSPLGLDLRPYDGPHSFDCANVKRVTSEDWNRMERVCGDYADA